MSIYASVPRTWTQLDALDVTTRRALLDKHAPLDASTLGPYGGRLRYLSSPDRQADLAAYFYPADPSVPYKAVIVAVHGHGAYWQFEFLRMAVVGRAHVYGGSWVEALNKAGYSVCGVDNTGSGRSSGKFGLVERAEDLRDDVLALVRAVRGMGEGPEAEAALLKGGKGASAAPAAKRRGGAAAAPAPSSSSSSSFGQALAGLPGFCASLPLFLLGPSLGGCVAVQSALAAEARLGASASSPFAGVVLLAPLLGLEGAASRGWNPYLRRIAALLDACPLTREWPVAAQDANTMFPEQQLDFETDPATWHYPCRVRTAVQLLRACAGALPLGGGGVAAPAGGAGAAAQQQQQQQQRAGQPLREAAKRLRAPVLAFHSARDTLCDCSATEAFVAGAREGQAARRAAAAAGGGGRKAAALAEELARLRRCDHLWHSVLREDTRGELLREAVAWMDARLAAATAAGGGKRGPASGAAHAAARISVSATAGAAAAAKGAAAPAPAPATSPRAPRGRRAAAAR